ncbi:hypothetical protein HRbin02_00405 [Candidatus Calditenuaceae archaeon HR02]|nr:hypothetical protein HRbin02_00405 [Candidatus Calditenuaceae archaeon HR02]
MSAGLIVRLLFKGLRNALTAVRLVSELEGLEVRAIYIGRESVEEMYEVVLELSANSVVVNDFLRNVSASSGFIEACVEDLDARAVWEGIR